jgi:hypothetical protein
MAPWLFFWFTCFFSTRTLFRSPFLLAPETSFRGVGCGLDFAPP